MGFLQTGDTNTQQGQMEAKTTQRGTDTDILFSRAVKAGQRIYYLDVKENRRKERYLSITESKKTVSGVDEDPHVTYEKHKIFLFPEDFQKFLDSLEDAMAHARTGSTEDDGATGTEEIHIDLDFPTEP